MLALTVFILKSGRKQTDIEKLTMSIPDSIHARYVTIDRLSVIDDYKPETEWYMVLYDNEFISPSLAKSLHVYMHHDFDFYIIMKRIYNDDGNMEVTQSPRLFRKPVKLSRDSLMPINSEKLKSERIMDGWILDEKSLSGTFIDRGTFEEMYPTLDDVMKDLQT